MAGRLSNKQKEDLEFIKEFQGLSHTLVVEDTLTGIKGYIYKCKGDIQIAFIELKTKPKKKYNFFWLQYQSIKNHILNTKYSG